MPAEPLTFDALALPYVLDDPYPYKMIEGGVYAAMVSVAIEEDWEESLTALDGAIEKVVAHPRLILATRRADIEAARSTGKVAIVPLFQGAQMVAGRNWRLRVLYRLGLRCIQVTYSGANLYGSGLGERNDGGLTFGGRDFVEEANALGLLLDASHCGPKTSADIVQHSAAPVAFTHANAQGKCPNPRNKPDGVLKMLAERDGVAGAVTLPRAVSLDHEPRLDDYLDMVDYMVNLMGVDHVGFGSDFVEGNRDTTKGLEDALRWRRLRPDVFGDLDHFQNSRYPIGLEGHAEVRNLASALKSRGYSDLDVRKILSENFLRIFEAVVG